jgi:serine/threonine protein kinase
MDNSLRPTNNSLRPTDNIRFTTDHEINKIDNIGKRIKIGTQSLGKGSYGSVFLCTDENGRQFAAKKCKSDKEEGIKNILEAIIMASLCHPYLNRALHVCAKNNKLYIIQELALTDLSQYTRRKTKKHHSKPTDITHPQHLQHLQPVKPTISQLQYWCYCLLQAVDALHERNIIHADIKACNVFLYPNDYIRLADFTLSMVKWKEGEKFNHNVCTSTHRPMECLIEDKLWDEKLDIWSLGCTFYEIAYGKSLFPYQGRLEYDHDYIDKLYEAYKNNPEKAQHAHRAYDGRIIHKIKTKANNIVSDNIQTISNRSFRLEDIKERINRRAINCILNWHGLPIQHNIEYLPAKYVSDYYNPEYEVFNDLVSHMLCLNAEERWNTKQLLNHSFFKDFEGMVTPSSGGQRPIDVNASKMRDIEGVNPSSGGQGSLNVNASKMRDIEGVKPTSGGRKPEVVAPTLSKEPYLGFKRPPIKLSVQETERVKNQIATYTRNVDVRNLAFSIYIKCRDLDAMGEGARVAGCAWIASKIIRGYPVKVPPELNILVIEREICHNTHFRLHFT